VNRTGPAGLLLWPGAGADRDHPMLTALEQGLAPFPVARLDFPNRRAGKKGPERAPVAQASIRDEAAAFARAAGVEVGRLVLGGRSFGGRMCSMVAADGLEVAGLVLLSYPLHPPGRPDRLRIEHLASLSTTCLFVHGARDPFGTPDELQAATTVIPAPVSHVWVPGGHDPSVAQAGPAVTDAVAEFLRGLGADSCGPTVRQ
jgi:predicted alpha/beta-hydrolase family hydrolase